MDEEVSRDLTLDIDFLLECDDPYPIISEWEDSFIVKINELISLTKNIILRLNLE
jgi:hypothetical protein